MTAQEQRDKVREAIAETIEEFYAPQFSLIDTIRLTDAILSLTYKDADGKDTARPMIAMVAEDQTPPTLPPMADKKIQHNLQRIADQFYGDMLIPQPDGTHWVKCL